MSLDIRGNGESKIQTNTKKERNDFFSVSEPKYEFGQIILSDSIQSEMKSIIGFYNNRQRIFEEWGLKEVFPNKRSLIINFYGESGTGKTMCAHALAHAIGKKLVVVDYSSIESKYVGETSKNLVKVFEYAKENEAVLFFDEADALLSKRVTDMSNSTDISVNQTKSVLLGLLNDYSEMVIFTTNFISNYDFAFMRRIQYNVRFELPNKLQREKIWKTYLPKKLPTTIDIVQIAEKYEGVSGADISNAVFKAVIRAACEKKKVVEHFYFVEEIEKILKAKQENQGIQITTREVTEEYALSQIKGGQRE